MQISNDSQYLLKSKSYSCQQQKLDRGTRSTNRKPGTLIRGDYTASDWSKSEEDELESRKLYWRAACANPGPHSVVKNICKNVDQVTSEL
jgi:hypothetical protein